VGVNKQHNLLNHNCSLIGILLLHHSLPLYQALHFHKLVVNVKKMVDLLTVKLTAKWKVALVEQPT